MEDFFLTKFAILAEPKLKTIGTSSSGSFITVNNITMNLMATLPMEENGANLFEDAIQIYDYSQDVGSCL